MFHQSLKLIRDKIGIFGEPFDVILEHADVPPEIAAIDGYHCIAEEMISAGRQCTLAHPALPRAATLALGAGLRPRPSPAHELVDGLCASC